MAGMNYKDLENRYVPRDELVEMFAEYYGEENRNLIETKIKKDMNIVFLVQPDLLIVEVKNAFKKVYKDNPSIDIDKEAGVLIDQLREFAADGKLFSELYFAKYARVLNELGFDMRKILQVNPETKLPEIIASEETNKLKNYLNYTVNKKELELPKINTKFIAVQYNLMAREKKLNNLMSNNIGSDAMTVSPGKDILNKYDDIDDPLPEIDIANLKEEDEAILSFFIQAKNWSKLVDEDFTNYIVQGVNRIFKKEFTSLNEMCEDRQLALFFDFMNEANITIAQAMRTLNVDSKKYISKGLSDNEYGNVNREFEADRSMNAFARDTGEYIAIPTREDARLRTTAHEVNHFLGIKGTKDYTSQGSAFKTNNDSTGFNEIVNEFLTKRAMENYNKNHPNSQFKDTGCGYDGGVKIMNKFLLKFEKKLKECQLQNARNQGLDATQLLEKYIGVANCKRIIEYGKILEDLNYGEFNISVEHKGEMVVGTALEWLELYKEDSSIAEQTPDMEKLSKLIEIDNFLEQMVAHFEEFEKGNIVDINPKGYLREAENVNESGLQKDYE